MTDSLDRQPPAITQPGEMWHLNGFNLSTVMVHRPGVNPIGVASFVTVRDAAAAVQARNAWEEICAAYKELGELDDAFSFVVRSIVEKYGRTDG